MVLLMQKVTVLEIRLNNPKQKQGNGRDSPLLSLNIEKKVEEAQQKKECQFILGLAIENAFDFLKTN